MSELTGYGPGFPVGRVETITKRELFAAMAMQGLLASQIHGMPNMPSKLPFAAIALDAADALIAALKGEG